MMCRWGGEEFVIMLPETSSEQAKIWAERARSAIEQQTTELESGEKVNVTVSIGIASLTKDISTKELIHQADEALYQAKENGRNQIAVYKS